MTSSCPLSTPRILCVSVVVILLGVHALVLIWSPTLSYRTQPPRNRTVSEILHQTVHHPGPSTNTSLTIYPRSDKRRPAPDRVMLIHVYNESPTTQHHLSFKDCRHSCALTNNSDQADLLYINAGQLTSKIKLPRRTNPNQIWLLYSREPPTFPRFNSLTREDLSGQINWTRAIFSDATFPLVYGCLQKEKLQDRDFDAIYDSKNFSVAWFVGHCDTPSLREEYVRRMMLRVDVHIYGLCGNMTCGVRGYNMGGDRDKCLRMLSRNYKFYLAFENSFCENYVTEKFFNLFRNYIPVDVIPVVRGGADYRRHFDSNILVNAADFRSPEELGDYLSQLSSDKTRYVAMLRRKSRYTLQRLPEKFECSMCRSLHEWETGQYYDDIYSFWRHPNRCHEPRDLAQEQDWPDS